mmetsp:Transcript_65246/g.183675  ORF Transcript_65246/g.183675 Transcript_65246/m.183675 type:complete len:182 (+) Transcript_65246:116-661(+)
MPALHSGLDLTNNPGGVAIEDALPQPRPRRRNCLPPRPTPVIPGRAAVPVFNVPKLPLCSRDYAPEDCPLEMRDGELQTKKVKADLIKSTEKQPEAQETGEEAGEEEGADEDVQEASISIFWRSGSLALPILYPTPSLLPEALTRCAGRSTDGRPHDAAPQCRASCRHPGAARRHRLLAFL